MPSQPIRWLHLSDFHIGRDPQGEMMLFDSILDHVKKEIKEERCPDMVFITGDIAFSGKKDQYELFYSNFYSKLFDILKSARNDLCETRIFIVPGNHDVDITKARAVNRYGILKDIKEFLDPTEIGLVERTPLFLRFDGFVENVNNSKWLFSKNGFYTEKFEIKGLKIGILGLNTAWLANGGNEDRHKLSPGKAIIKNGLKKIDKTDVHIVIGHHPIDWFIDSEVESIKALFSKNEVIYLHGHLHKNSVILDHSKGKGLLAFQSGAAFQAREDECWINRFLLCTHRFEDKVIDVDPRLWANDNQEWCSDSAAFSEDYKEKDRDIWSFPFGRIQKSEKTSFKENTKSKNDNNSYSDNTSKPFINNHSHLNYDRKTVNSYSVDDLDINLVKKFLSMPLTKQRLEDHEFNDDDISVVHCEKLKALGCICDGQITLGTFYCFAPKELLVDKFGACSLQMVLYHDNLKAKSKSTIIRKDDNLLSLYDEGITWLTSRAGLRNRGNVGHSDRDELEIPAVVLREALANALVHRDYESKEFRDQPTRIEVYPNRIEIISFGHLVPQITFDMLNSDFEKTSFRRNYLISEIFLGMSYVELNASGVQRMRVEMEEASLAFPHYTDVQNSSIVRVRLLRPTSDSNDKTDLRKSPSPISGQFSVAISGTEVDMIDHRRKAYLGCQRQGFYIQDFDYSLDIDPTSQDIMNRLTKIETVDIYILIVGFKYGFIPDGYSVPIKEIEYNKAVELNIPILAFFMHENHPVTRSMIELNTKTHEQLELFKLYISDNHSVTYFESPDDLYRKINDSLLEIAPRLDQPKLSRINEVAIPENNNNNFLPVPPEFYAEPPYIGAHEFIGRRSELETLDDWAKRSDPYPVLLFEAIGGTGKSMLTWEWINNYAQKDKKRWAGCFWYSFYERGAIMSDFCAHALAYITGKPFNDFKTKKTTELGPQLIQHLKEKPWLIVLDGLERVLVAYHRIDAAQITDEEAGDSSDQIANRNVCDTISPEDDDILRSLAGASRSKLLITSRLVPRALLSSSNQPINGVKHERLSGLRPVDAEALFRLCGIDGDSKIIQNYLKQHCDCHPLVVGALAGLINDYLPDRGNFNAWVRDPDYGDKLNLTDLDLVQKRNHILNAALVALDEMGYLLLSTLALLSEAVDYKTLSAFNPHIQPDTDDSELNIVSQKLINTVRDLEDRGFLQYDSQSKRFNLHPVVRAVVKGKLKQSETEKLGQRVVDHFSKHPHSPYDTAEILEDLSPGINVVRTLLQMDHYQRACDFYLIKLSNPLILNLEAYIVTLSLLRPFFPRGWDILPGGLDQNCASNLMADVAISLAKTGEFNEAFKTYSTSLEICLKNRDWVNLYTIISSISSLLSLENRLSKEKQFCLLVLEIATLNDDKKHLFRTRLDCFTQLSCIGKWTEAEEMWLLLDPMGRNWPRNIYRLGEAEYNFAQYNFGQDKMIEEHLLCAEKLANEGNNRVIIRSLHELRGKWEFENKNFDLAITSFEEAVRMAREVGIIEAEAETLLAIAKLHLDKLTDPVEEAERLSGLIDPAHRELAELWLSIGIKELAKKYALEAYKWAWADGEPYVNRYELNKTIELLEKLDVEIPDLPHYDPEKDEKFPWEDDLVAAIEELRAEKEAEAKEAEDKTEDS
jgi:tetratricopeptide (TPR) repeat protein/predicted phosphodiesterase